MYYVVFIKRFAGLVFGAREFEFAIYKTENKESAIEKAKQFNEDPLLNLTTENFAVYESETKTWNKKKTKLIYPK